MPKPTVDLSTPWSQWKAHPGNALRPAAEVAAVIAGSLLIFLYLFIQEPRRLLLVGGGAFVVLWLFLVGVSAATAYRQTEVLPLIPPDNKTAKLEID
jgi:hypothetical protein